MQIQIQAQIHNKGSRYHRIAEKRTEPVLAISWWCLRHSRFLFLLLLWIFFRFFFFLILFQFSFSLYIAHRIGCSAAPVKPSWKRVFHISMFIYMNISLSGEIAAIWSEKRVQLPRNIFFFFLPLIDISDNNKTARKKNDNFQPLRGSQLRVVSCSKLSSRSWLGFLAEPQHPKPNPNPNSKKNNNIDINFSGQPLQPQLPTLTLGS